MPKDATFFLAQISTGREPEANRRWALLEDGRVMFSSNTAPAKVSQDAPFNTAMRTEPIAHLDSETLGVVSRLPAEAEVWSTSATAEAVDALIVSDGSDR